MFLSVHVPKSKEPKAAPKRWTGPLKTVGAISATVSFLVVLNQITGVVQDFRIHHLEFREAMQAGEQAQNRGDYHAAFDSFRRATDLDPIDHRAQERQTESAMLWLENVHETPDRTFTETANLLLPVFDKGLGRARGSAAADILAHVGWANYLRYRDGVREGVTVEENFRQALSKDPNNVYAHAMWGFWILWQGGKFDAATQHFSAALASGRRKDYVRSLQLGAMKNSDDEDAKVALLRVANEMRKAGESVSPTIRRSIYDDAFFYKLPEHDRLVRSLSVLSPADTEATYDWVSEIDNSQGERWKRANRTFIIGNLKETTGNRAEALSIYKSLQESLRGTDYLDGPLREAIKRVSATPSK